MLHATGTYLLGTVYFHRLHLGPTLEVPHDEAVAAADFLVQLDVGHAPIVEHLSATIVATNVRQAANAISLAWVFY